MNRQPRPGSASGKSLPDIVSESFWLYLRHRQPFLKLSLAAAVLAAAQFFATIQLFKGLGIANTSATVDSSKTGQLLLSSSALYFAGLLSRFLVEALMLPAAIAAVQGRPVSARLSVRSFTAFVPAIIVLWAAVSLALGVMLALVLPIPVAIFLGVGWSFAIQIVCLQRVSAFKALPRSLALVRGHWWRVLAVQVAIVVLTLLPQFAFLRIAGLFNNDAVSIVAAGAAGWVAAPFGTISRTLLYADLLKRKDLPLEPPQLLAS